MRKILSFFVMFTLLLLVSVFPVGSGGEVTDWVLEERGPNYDVYRNSADPGLKRWVSAPQRVWDTDSWVSFVFQDLYESDGKYVVKTGLISAEIFDYYAAFYDPNMTEVRVYDERWEVERWLAERGKWDVVRAQSGIPTFTISKSETCVNVTKSFHSWAGWLNITYIFRVGSPLKHEVVFRSEIAEETTFRVVQKWSGIVGGKVKHNGGEETVTSAVTVNSTWFEFLKEDGSFTVYENQRSMIEYLEPVTIDVHAQGLKADFVFSNWTLTQGETLEIDPTTVTFQVLDSIYNDSKEYGTGVVDPSSDYVDIESNTNADAVWWGGFRFTGVNIPNGVTITAAFLEVYVTAGGLGASSSDDPYFYIHAEDVDNAGAFTTSDYDISSRPRTSANVLWDETNIGEEDWKTSPDIASIIQEVIDRAGWVSGNALVIIGRPVTTVYRRLRCYAYDYGASYAAKLEVIYNEHYPTNDACDSTETFVGDYFGWVNVTISDLDGNDTLNELQIKVDLADNKTFTFNWTQSTDTFAEVSDPDDIATLNATASVRTNVNSTTEIISFYFKIGLNTTTGYANVTATVTDDSGLSDIDLYQDEFKVYIYTSTYLEDFVAAVNAVFAYFGITDFVTTMLNLINDFAQYLTDSITYATDFLASIFSFFGGVVMFILDWFGRVVSTFLNIASIVKGILDGTHDVTTGLGNIWTFINLSTWIDAVPILMLIAWFVSLDERGKRTGNWMAVFMSDISTIIAVLSFIFNLAMQVINTVVDYVFRFFQAIPT